MVLEAEPITITITITITIASTTSTTTTTTTITITITSRIEQPLCIVIAFITYLVDKWKRKGMVHLIKDKR
jgi:hypothetical protein